MTEALPDRQSEGRHRAPAGDDGAESLTLAARLVAASLAHQVGGEEVSMESLADPERGRDGNMDRFRRAGDNGPQVEAVSEDPNAGARDRAAASRLIARAGGALYGSKRQPGGTIYGPGGQSVGPPRE